MKKNFQFKLFKWAIMSILLPYMLFFSACKGTDEPKPAPTIEISSGSTSMNVEAGVELSLGLDLSAPEGIKSLAITNSLTADGNVTKTYGADTTSAAYTYTFTPSVTTADGTSFTLKVVLTDLLNRATEELEVTVTISASDAAKPVIALKGSEVAEGERSGTADFDLTLTSEAGLKSLFLEVNGTVVDPINLVGTPTGDYTFGFVLPDTVLSGEIYQLRVAAIDLLDQASMDTIPLVAVVINSPSYVISDVEIGGTTIKRIKGDLDEDVTLDNGPYLLYGEVGVDAGSTLTISAGQTIYGFDTEEMAGILDVSGGGIIKANGTANNPIIFTSIKEFRGETPAHGDWGGVEINGNGTDEDPEIDFSYVQINYAGANDGSGGRYEGLKLSDLGSEAGIHHIQIYACADEGIRMDGGSVNVKYLVVGNGMDSDINWDEWDGFGQFWLVIGQVADKGEDERGDRGIDGNDGFDPKVTNISIIGPGGATGLKAQAARIDDDPVFEIYNAIFMGWPDDGVEIEQEASNFTADLATSDGIIAYSYLWNNDGGGLDNWKDDGDFFDPTENAIFSNVMDSPIAGINPTSWMPSATQVSVFDPSTIDSWFDNAAYVGAFDGTTDWTAGWTDNLD